MDTEAENNYDKLYINVSFSKSHSKYLFFACISSFFVVAVLDILKAVVLTIGSSEVWK